MPRLADPERQLMVDPLTLLDYVLIGLAAVAGGAVNAVAGGGTLITFPVLTAVGIPAVAANITNTVALAPGYLSGTLAQKNDLQGQRRRLWLLVPAGALGGLVGGLLLVRTEERVFQELIPWLILLASVLLAMQGRVRSWLVRRQAAGHRHPSEFWVVAPVFAGCHLWRLFWRRVERNHLGRPGSGARRFSDPAQCVEAGRRLQRQRRRGPLFCDFGPGRLVGGAGDGDWGHSGGHIGRTPGWAHQT